MRVRTLHEDETLIFAKVHFDSMVEIVTNKDASPEDSLESNVLDVLSRLR